MRRIVNLLILLVSTSVLQATPVDITFTEDDIIQNGDSYNYAYLYNGGTGQTTVEMIGGSVERLVLYDDSHFFKKGGYINEFASTWGTSQFDATSAIDGYVYTHETSTFNLYSGGSIYGAFMQANSTTNIYGGTFAYWLKLDGDATLNIFGGDFSPPTDITVNDNAVVNVYYLTREYVGGAYSGILADGSPFLLSNTFNYYEVPEPATLLLLSLGAVRLRSRQAVILRKRKKKEITRQRKVGGFRIGRNW